MSFVILELKSANQVDAFLRQKKYTKKSKSASIFACSLHIPICVKTHFLYYLAVPKYKIYSKKELQNVYVRKIVFLLFIFEIQEFDLKNEYFLKEQQ